MLRNDFGLIFAASFGLLFDTLNLFNMKKTFIIALCCIVALMAACKKKPVEPTPEPEPEPIDYAANYVGNYLGIFTLTIFTMNNEEVNNMNFLVDNIRMDLAKGEEFNAVTATVTVDNESRQTTGIANEKKTDFESVNLIIDKPDQHYMFNLDLKLEGNKPDSDSLNISGTFSGSGNFEFMGETQILDEVSGIVNGKLGKQ